MQLAEIVHSSIPSVHRHAIMLACDKKFFPYAACVAKTLADNAPERAFDIVICCDEPLDLPPSLADAGIRSCQMAFKGALTDARLLAGKSPGYYFRLALPEAFASEYSRILYLDADIHVDGGNFEELLAVDLGGRAFGAVLDVFQWRRRKWIASEFVKLDIPHTPYFNSGVLLIDVAAWRAQNVTERSLDVWAEHGTKVVTHYDQSLLNVAMRNDWAELSPVWNWQYTWKTLTAMYVTAPYVIHFIGIDKLWRDSAELPVRARRHLANFLTQDFPGVEGSSMENFTRWPSKKFYRRVHFRQLVAMSRPFEYLSRFPTDLTVLQPEVQ